MKDAQVMSSSAKALVDVSDGIRLWRVWTTLGWNDILQRYRRSLLGPFWLTASMATMVIALGVVYSRIFKTDLDNFMPFLSVGLIFWTFISSILTESGTLLTGNESYIKQIRLPYSIYAFRFVWSKIIILAHNLVIYFGVLIYFQLLPGASILAVFPGFLLIVLNAFFASLLIGMTAARFRDIPQIIASVVQIVFFVTPIMWKPEFLNADSKLLYFNPFFHLIEIVRAPLLGQLPPWSTVSIVLLLTFANGVVTMLFFVRFRSRIAYWS